MAKTPAAKPEPAAAPSASGGGKPKSKPKPAPASEPTAAGIDYRAPEYLTLYDAETAQVAGEKVLAVGQLKGEWERIHAEAAAAKKAFESADKDLHQYLNERVEGRGKAPKADLFTSIDEEEIKAKLEAEKGKKKGGKAIATSEPEKPAAGWYPADLWKRYPLDRVQGMQKADTVKLAEGKVKGKDKPSPMWTVGDLTQFSEPDASGNQAHLKDVLGPKAAQRVEDALTSHHAVWPSLVEAYAVECGFKRPDPFEGTDQPTTLPFTGGVPDDIARAIDGEDDRTDTDIETEGEEGDGTEYRGGDPAGASSA